MPHSPLQFYVAQLSLVDAVARPLEPLIQAHLNWLKAAGVDGVLVLGTNGEFPHFTIEQRKRYLETWLSCNPGLNVMVNIGAANIPDVLELQQHAASLKGISKLLWMPPFYFPGEELNGLVEALDLILGNQPQDLPLYLYNFPRMSQVVITTDILRFDHRITGMKDSSGDYVRIAEMISACPDKEIFIGTDYHITQAQSIGATGIISGLGNVFPHLIRQSIDKENPNLEETLRRLRNACETYTKIPGFKAYLNHLSLSPGWETEPLLPMKSLSPTQIKHIVSSVESILEGASHHVPT